MRYNMAMSAKKWKLVRRVLEMQSTWVTLYADRLLDNTGREIEYWHVDRADSVIVLVVHKGHFLLPEPSYRPGVEEVTVDFAGGRLPKDQTPAQAAAHIIKRELGVAGSQVVSLEPITKEPLVVDSSFSNQRLYGFVAEISEAATPKDGTRIHPLSKIEPLRQKLQCLQCRALLNEFVLQWQRELLS